PARKRDAATTLALSKPTPARSSPAKIAMPSSGTPVPSAQKALSRTPTPGLADCGGSVSESTSAVIGRITHSTIKYCTAHVMHAPSTVEKRLGAIALVETLAAADVPIVSATIQMANVLIAQSRGYRRTRSRSNSVGGRSSASHRAIGANGRHHTHHPPNISARMVKTTRTETLRRCSSRYWSAATTFGAT